MIVHANGDRAIQQTLNVYKATLNADLNVSYHIEHFTVTNPKQIARARQLGLGVSHLMRHVSS